MTLGEIADIVSEVKFPNHSFLIRTDGLGCYLQVVMTDQRGHLQSGRKWKLSQFMTKSEIVQTAFKALLTFIEHEVREGFTYKGQAIFGPHFDVDRLVSLCEQKALDLRVEKVS